MKNQAWKLTLCVLFATSVAFGQSQARITVSVPFAFVISDKMFPAGEYSVSSLHDKITVQDSSGKAVFLAMTNEVSGRHVGSTGQIVFHCYDSHCFLSEFWTPTRENGNQLLPSRYEAELAKQKKGTEFALVGQAPKR